jgi:hypothetical protein
MTPKDIILASYKDQADYTAWMVNAEEVAEELESLPEEIKNSELKNIPCVRFN